jgi:phage FluMu protein Com
MPQRRKKHRYYAAQRTFNNGEIYIMRCNKCNSPLIDTSIVAGAKFFFSCPNCNKLSTLKPEEVSVPIKEEHSSFDEWWKNLRNNDHLLAMHRLDAFEQISARQCHISSIRQISCRSSTAIYFLMRI